MNQHRSTISQRGNLYDAYQLLTELASAVYRGSHAEDPLSYAARFAMTESIRTFNKADYALLYAAKRGIPSEEKHTWRFLKLRMEVLEHRLTHEDYEQAQEELDAIGRALENLLGIDPQKEYGA